MVHVVMIVVMMMVVMHRGRLSGHWRGARGRARDRLLGDGIPREGDGENRGCGKTLDHENSILFV